MGVRPRRECRNLRGVIENLGMRLMPTVNVVLNKTRSDLGRFFLQRWRQGMIQELGEEGFKKHQEINEIQIQESNKGHWESLQSVLDVLYVIDWKTSSKPKPLLSNLYDNPLQVAAYLGAINLRAEFTSKFGVVDHAAIVVAYQNGQPAHIHRMKPAMCQHYWTQWCQRLHQYWAMVAAEKGITATPP
nr:hypothetical protein BaRGS_012278 [Batillaria attramentaria]